MNWLAQIADYWKAEYPDRDFARIRPLVRLTRLSLLMPAFQKHVLRPHDLSPTDYSILGALRRAGQPRQLKPGDLYNTLGCTPGGLTKMVDRLEKRGLVERLTDRVDGRRARIRLTPKGEAVGERAFDDYNEATLRLMERLSTEELAQIDTALDLLLQCLEPEDEDVIPTPALAVESFRGLKRAMS